MRWYTAVIPAHNMIRQDDVKFKTTLKYLRKTVGGGQAETKRDRDINIISCTCVLFQKTDFTEFQIVESHTEHLTDQSQNNTAL